MATEFPTGYYKNRFTVGNASTAPVSDDVGFNSEYFRLANVGAQPIYFNPRSSSAATTADAEIESSGVIVLKSPIRIRRFTLFTTSTVAGGQLVNVFAFQR